jgi:hypothetical protein
MRRPLALISGWLLAGLATLLAAGASAGADVFGGISLVSESLTQQAEYAHDAAISGDGRYVAFDGSFGGALGVWRRDLQTGAVEQVAPGDAQLPSMSDDGRYVSFTTTAALAPGDHNVGPDVYVRDMSVAAAEPGAYTLVSALDGSEEGLTYQAGSEPASYGSIASGRSALSGDGRKVVFVMTAVSDLIGARPPAAPETPAMQVAVRDLDTKTTQLVSVVQPATGQSQAVSAHEGANTFGAVYGEGAPGVVPRFRQVESYGQSPYFGASISADGSTVAWLAQNIGQQAPALPGEALPPIYAEPLWRRIADGPHAPTRRITGGSDPANPACAASGEQAVPQEPSTSDPCQGPFATFKVPTTPGTWTGGAGDMVPRLSSDGYTVAFLANAPLVSFGAGFGTEHSPDLYIANMHEGLTRAQALRPLTEIASGENELATDAPIFDLGISPDARAVAFTTKRTVFPLGSPAYVSARSPVPGMLELFDVDLADDTLTRVTRGFEGGASDHPHETKQAGEDPYTQTGDGALSPSYTADGNTLAFSSTAANLAFGDGNTPPLGHESRFFDGSDAFLVSRVRFGSSAPENYISSPPPNPSIEPAWRLAVAARSRRDGSVVLEVVVPGGGSLRAGARSALLVRAVSSSRRTGRSHHRPPAAKVATRTVATRAARPSGAGLVALTLKLARHYGGLASRRGGLSATVSVVFTSPGHPALKDRLGVTFRRVVRSRSRAKRAHARRHAARRGGR